MTKKILITGASGIVAESVIRLLANESKHELFTLSSKAGEGFLADFTPFRINAVSLKEIKSICVELKPDVIINCASLSNPLLCEKDKKTAWNLNAALVETLASASRINDSHLIIYSTDCIFDGKNGPYTEEAKPNPLNYFGKTKHSGENFCFSNLKKYTIVRITNPYGISSFNKMDILKKSLLELKLHDEVILPVNFMTNFTFTEDIALCTYKIIEKERLGIWNASGHEFISLYEAVKIAAKIFSLDESKIKPIESLLWDGSIRYPKNGGLVNLKAETGLGMKFSKLENGLISYKYLDSLI